MSALLLLNRRTTAGARASQVLTLSALEAHTVATVATSAYDYQPIVVRRGQM